MYDVVVIGAGITGSLIALGLSKFTLQTVVLEKNNDIADGATMANSAIVHTGYDPEDGTLKARLNVEGARLYPQLMKDLGCMYKQVGAYVAACGSEEEKKLEVLADRARRRDIPHAFLTGCEARRCEPFLSDHVTKVLSFPTTAVIYPWEVAIAAMETAVNNGTKLHLNTEVEEIVKKEDGFIVKTNQGDFETKIVISCAGTHAEEIASMVSKQVPYQIRPRKGEYYVLAKDTNFVQHIIFPVPGPKGKGVLAVPTVYGNVLIGPNSAYCNDPDSTSHTIEGLAEVKQNINKTMKDVPFQQVIRSFAGLRPSSTSKDFVITEYDDAPGFIDAASIESPGLASAPAIASYVITNFVKKHLLLVEDPNAVMTRKRPLVMSELSEDKRNEVIRKDPAYGNIICRCEKISEGEIRDAVQRVCGAISVKGIKKRIRPGMGKCQGGFCEPHVLALLVKYTGQDPLAVVLDNAGSNILKGENR